MVTKPPAMNSSEYWSEVYRKELERGDHRLHEAVWQAVEPLIPPSGELVDIGCGTGAFLRWLRPQRDLRLRLVGIDHSRHAIRWARNWVMDRGAAIDFGVGDAYKTDCSPVYDVVYSGHLIEHLVDPIAALQEQWRILKSGGWVICHFPYQDNPYIEHVHILDFEMVRGWLQTVGFEIGGESEVFPGAPTADAFIWAQKV